jgi:hypothetical protein
METLHITFDWFMYVFFFGGSVGGWVVLIVLLIDWIMKRRSIP